MRALVGIDLRGAGHEWLVERAGLYAERLSAPLDVVYFLGDGTEFAEYKLRLTLLMSSLPPVARGVARIEHGHPAEGFVQLSSEYDVLVVGSREPTALERLLHGPMAGRVLRSARCPVRRAR